jgi:hypothetical protein
MEHQTEGLGLRPPDTAEEATSEAAADPASEAAADLAGAAGADLAGAAGADLAGEAPADLAGEAPADLAGETGAGPEQRPATGEPRVDAALARLDELEGLPVTEHRAVFEDVHRRLRDVLGELDTGQPREGGHAAGAAGRPGR